MEEEESFWREAYNDWGPEGNEKLYLGYYSAAVPEGVNVALSQAVENPPAVWKTMTDYGLDKVSHLGFSFFGAKALMKSSETFPEYMQRMDESDAPFSDKIYHTGVKLSEPSMQQKTALALGGVAVLGIGKEATDTAFDYLDMTANMTGASLGVLDEYGNGSIRRGAARTFEDVRNMLENEERNEEPAPELYANGGREIEVQQLDSGIKENMEALGKL